MSDEKKNEPEFPQIKLPAGWFGGPVETGRRRYLHAPSGAQFDVQVSDLDDKPYFYGTYKHQNGEYITVDGADLEAFLWRHANALMEHECNMQVARNAANPPTLEEPPEEIGDGVRIGGFDEDGPSRVVLESREMPTPTADGDA